jgi:perosamine synthetase
METVNKKSFTKSRLMKVIGPQSRLRLATGASFYWTLFNSFLRGRASSSENVAEFERWFARYQSQEFCRAVPMARTGIYLVIKALIRPGQKVVMSPYTISEVVNMVICAGGQPVFCDVKRDTCNMCPIELDQILRSENNVGTVLVTHFYGLMSDLPEISSCCEKFSVPLVEDAAQALGSSVEGKPAGTWGKAGVFSFGMFKSVNALYGGAIVTNDQELNSSINDIWALEKRGISASWLFKKAINATITDIVTRDFFFSSFFFRFFRWATINKVDSVTRQLKIDLKPVARSIMPPDYLYDVSDLQI